MQTIEINGENFYKSERKVIKQLKIRKKFKGIGYWERLWRVGEIFANVLKLKITLELKLIKLHMS